MKPPAQPGHVYLVGAGPGDASLLTLRAHQLLSTASHILPDGLISEEILAAASPSATIIPVGKRCGMPRVTQEEINELIVQSAQSGASVVRLKSGDPLVFGRAAEEIAAVTRAGLPLEIVPGISAAFAAAAAMQTPLTDRTGAAKLILATAHHAASKAALDPEPKPIWTGPLPNDATLVLYMPGPNLEALARQLIKAGIHVQTPVTTISRVSSPEQHIYQTRLGELDSLRSGPSPVLVLVGRSVAPMLTRTGSADQT